MTVFQKFSKLLKTPGMMSAYRRYCVAAMIGHGPYVPSGPGNCRISRRWISFSEYWTFRNGIDPSEQKLLGQCASLCRKNSLAMDIGANVGLYTVGMAAVGFRVHSFEPVDSTFERLAENIAATGIQSQVTLNKSAMGDRCGTAKFIVEPDSPATNHFSAQRDVALTNRSEISVQVTTLDTYMREHALDSIDFLKIDVEGFEPAVLRGARETLSRRAIHVILLEVCPPLLERAGESTASLYGVLHDSGYRICLLAADGTCGEELGSDALDQMVLANILAVPR